MMTEARKLDRIKRYGRVLQRLTLALMLLAPVVAVFVVTQNGPLALVNVPSHIAVDPAALTFPRSLAIVAVGLLTPVTYLLGFVFLYRLFSLYARGIVFSSDNVNAIRRCGYVLITVDAVRIIQSALVGPVLTVLGASERYVSIELGLSTLVVGLAVVVISHVMGLGCELYERDRLTI